MLEDIELRVRVRVSPNSPEAAVLKYLNSKNTLYPKSDMVLISLISYWLPLTCQFEEENHKNILSCLYRLTLHQRYLKEMLPASIVTEGDESQEQLQYVNPLRAKRKQSSKQYFTTIESQDISDSDATEWVNPLKPQGL